MKKNRSSNAANGNGNGNGNANRKWHLVCIKFVVTPPGQSLLDPHRNPNAPVQKIQIEQNDVINVSPVEFLVNMARQYEGVVLKMCVPITEQEAFAAMRLLRPISEEKPETKVAESGPRNDSNSETEASLPLAEENVVQGVFTKTNGI